MRTTDRIDFMSKINVGYMEVDEIYDTTHPQQIGFNTTISSVEIHAVTLQKLKPSLDNAKRALDIGTGSGYLAMCILKIMKAEDAVVYGIDHIPGVIH